jgi:hypothetical protein
LIESELEVIQKQLARLTTRRELPGTVLGIIFATMILTTLSLLFVLREPEVAHRVAALTGRMSIARTRTRGRFKSAPPSDLPRLS